MPKHDPLPPLAWDSRRVQIQGFTTGLYQIEWLLVTLVIFYLAIMGNPESSWDLVVSTGVYLGFSLTASRMRFFGERHRWLLAIHTWVMIGYITWFLYDTQGVTGPQASLYLLAVVICALTLGTLATMLEVAAIAACYLLLFQFGDHDLTSAANLALVGTNLIVFLIVGYLTSALIAAVQASNRMLLEMASQDPLTGLFNRRAFVDLVKPIHAAARRSRRPYSVIVIDMDELKAINDQLGHGAGDHAILALVQQIQGCKRSSDLVARYGGDEFVMLLPDTDTTEARNMMQRLIDDTQGETRISIGMASYPEHGDQFEQLLEHADSAMYLSKALGGNRVCVEDREDRVNAKAQSLS